MKLFYAKTGDKVCRHCKGTISRGEIYVVEQLNSNVGKWFMVLHYECFIPWKTKVLQDKYEAFKIAHQTPTKMGRKPIPCLDRPKRRKLLSLRAYHNKQGNMVRVAEIDQDIVALGIAIPSESVIIEGTVSGGNDGTGRPEVEERK